MTVAPEPIVIRVHGVPAPQGSKTAFVRGGRAIVTEGKGAGRVAHATWRQAVATAARDWQDANGSRELIDGPALVVIQFLMPKPRSKPKWKRWPDVKPDLDKLVRSVLDSLSGVILADDSRVVAITARKDYGDPPGCRVQVFDLSEVERDPSVGLWLAGELRDKGEAA